MLGVSGNVWLDLGGILKPEADSKLRYPVGEIPWETETIIKRTTIRFTGGEHPEYGIVVLDPPFAVTFSSKFQRVDGEYNRKFRGGKLEREERQNDSPEF